MANIKTWFVGYLTPRKCKATNKKNTRPIEVKYSLLPNRDEIRIVDRIIERIQTMLSDYFNFLTWIQYLIYSKISYGCITKGSSLDFGLPLFLKYQKYLSKLSLPQKQPSYTKACWPRQVLRLSYNWLNMLYNVFRIFEIRILLVSSFSKNLFWCQIPLTRRQEYKTSKIAYS